MVRLFLVVSPLLIATPFATGNPSFSAVQNLLTQSVADDTVAGGSLVVIHRGKTVFETGFGFADVKTRRPFRVDTPCVIASISKPLLGTAVFHLAEAGKLEITIPISEYVPEFAELKLESGTPVARAPTMVELLTHTSGIRNDEAPGGRPWYASWTKGQPLSFVVTKYAREFPFKAQPGTRYAYSGIGTDVAARVAELAAGKPRNEMLLEKVCEPLGMTNTFFMDSKRTEQADPMPTRYHRRKDGKLAASSKRTFPAPNTYSSSGGSIISTSADLSRWLLMIRNGGMHAGKAYLAPETIKQMLSGQRVGKNAKGGFFIRKDGTGDRPDVIGHTGSSGTNCWIDFENDIIGIMLTQTRGKDIRPFRIELEKRVAKCFSAR